MTTDLPPIWAGLFDDAAIFPPAETDLAVAVEAFLARRHEWYADLVASFVVTDQRVPEVTTAEVPLSIVVTGGAGAVAGALKLAARAGNDVMGLEIALRDLDDLPGNARRVVAALDAARGEGLLDDTTNVYVELPAAEVTHSWQAAADEVAAAELRLKFRTGGIEAHLFPSPDQLSAWIDAALDRELPFKCTAGLHNAIRHRDELTGFEHHGFLNVLAATAAAYEGTSGTEVTQMLSSSDAREVVNLATDLDLARARRWFTGIGSCSITEPLDDLLALGLLEHA